MSSMYGRMIDNIILQGVIYLDSGDAIQLGTIIILLALSAFFSSAETAYTTINRIRLRTLSHTYNQPAVFLHIHSSYLSSVIQFFANSAIICKSLTSIPAINLCYQSLLSISVIMVLSYCQNCQHPVKL